MRDIIVHANDPVTLVGGAPTDAETLSLALSLAPRLVAADSGAAAALAQGHVPEAVIGDMDSLSEADSALLPQERIHRIAEQDSTDFDKCLASIRAPLIVGLGFTGARLDHQMAAFNTLVRHPRQRCILIGAQEIILLAPPALRLDPDKGAVLSLFPMGAVEGLSDGLQWPLRGLNFAPDGQVGTSNAATGPVHLTITAPKMLVMLPVDRLDIVVTALTESAARWPDGTNPR